MRSKGNMLLIFMNSVRTLNRTQRVSTTVIHWLMSFKEIIAPLFSDVVCETLVCKVQSCSLLNRVVL
jgi:hypothetical protein